MNIFNWCNTICGTKFTFHNSYCLYRWRSGRGQREAIATVGKSSCRKIFFQKIQNFGL